MYAVAGRVVIMECPFLRYCCLNIVLMVEEVGRIGLRKMLLEVNLDTCESITLDGKKYLVNPGDLPTC